MLEEKESHQEDNLLLEVNHVDILFSHHLTTNIFYSTVYYVYFCVLIIDVVFLATGGDLFWSVFGPLAEGMLS